MAQLTLRIIGDISDVEQRITNLQNTLNQHPIQIQIQSSGADNVTRELVQYARQVARTAEAEANLQRQRAATAAAIARIAQAQAQLQTQQERTRTETQRTATAQAQLATQQEATNTETRRTVTVLGQLQVQQERTNTEVQRGVTEQARLTTEEQRTQTQQARLNVEQQRGENIALRLGNQYDLLTSILRRLRQIGINAVIQGFRDSIQTLKAVDDQLVAVRKVTGFDSTQIEQIKQQAFEVASAYGETADAYLESVAAFSRAGYKEQASSLAELATKTQIVGDTTSEVANQFLISVDAAYKYGGSIEELTKVLDGANEIDNKYATSIEKIASGMGIVAPVAAQMHVTIDELAASIGTITAVTQRSGTEAARALRALFLNIAGDTKTEIDEGVTWTTGEIEGLRDVIKQYAKDAYDAAQATGKVIDPMRAMEGLAKSMADGLLTEEKLVSMVSDIGGKLRTSQLLAIIQNWDMYQSMLQDYAGAIGSADKEVENALDSWTRKTNQLKNSVAELVSEFIQSDTVKNILDSLIGVVEVLDSSFGHLVITVGLVTAALALLASHPIITILSGVILLIGKLAAQHKDLEKAIQEETAELGKLKDAVDNVNKSRKDALETEQEAIAAAETTAAKANVYVNMLSEVKEGSEQYKHVLEQLIDTIPEVAQYVDQETGLLTVQRDEIRAVIEDWKNLALQQAATAHYTELYTKKIELLTARKAAWEDYNRAQQKVIDLEEAYQKKVKNEEVITREDGQAIAAAKIAVDQYADTLFAADIALTNVNAELASFDEEIRALAKPTQDETDKVDDLANAGKKAAFDYQALADKMTNLLAAISPLVDAQNELNEKGAMSESTMLALIKAYPELSSKIYATEKGYVVEKKALDDLITARTAEYNLTFNSAQSAAQAQIAALDSEASAWAKTTGQIKAYLTAKLAAMEASGVHVSGTGGDLFLNVGDEMYSGSPEEAAKIRNALREIEKAEKRTGGTIGLGTGTTDDDDKRGGGTVETAEEKEKKQQQEHLKGLQQIVADEKARYTLMEAQGATQEELAAQAKVIQGALHDQAEYMRDIEEPYASIAALSKEWFDWQKKIEEGAQKAADAEAKAAEAKRKAIEDAHKAELDARKQAVTDAKAEYDLMKAQGASREELAAKAKEIQGLLHDEAEYMRQVNSESGETVYTYAEIAALSEEWWDWQEKINDSIAETAAEAERVRQQQVDDAADHVSLLKQQLAFLKASGASDDEIIAKYKEIQAALHEQAEAMRAMGADEKDILALSTEWWDIQSQIQGVLDKTAETLKNEIKETIDDIVGQLQDQNDAQVAALQAEIDLMKEQHDAAEDTREEEEKRLAVEKARLDLENAQRERTVRQYNASTGQWEWVANAKNVQAAQEELAKSEAALNAYLAEQDYKKKIAELEAQKEETKSAFQTVKDAMNKFAEAVEKILESPKLDANAKKKFVDDIEAILKAPELSADIKDNFVSAVTDILEAPYFDETTKTEFVAEIKEILKSPTLPDDVKTKFLDGVKSILSIDALPATTKKNFIAGVTEILKSPTLPADVKKKFIDDITKILEAPTLTDKAKQTILNNLAALLNNAGIKDEVKVKISSAISTLVGKSKDAESAVALFSTYIQNALKTKNPETAIGQLYDAIMGGVVDINDIGVILAALNGEYASISTDAAKMLALSKMQANSIAWHMTEDAETRKALHDENEQLGNELGLTYQSSTGTWHDASGQQVYTLSNIGGDWLSELNDKIALVQELIDGLPKGSSGSDSSGGGSSAKDESNSKKETPSESEGGGSGSAGSGSDPQHKPPKSGDNTGVKPARGKTLARTAYSSSGAVVYYYYSDGTSEGYNLKTGAKVFDQGGLLHGMGGIKATTEDEMVIPPTLTKALLNAEKDGAFKALMKDLGIVTAASSQIAGYGGGQAPSSIGEQNNGDSYNFGNISLSEQQAKGMTVYDLAQLGRTLALQRGN